MASGADDTKSHRENAKHLYDVALKSSKRGSINNISDLLADFYGSRSITRGELIERILEGRDYTELEAGELSDEQFAERRRIRMFRPMMISEKEVEEIIQKAKT